MWTKIEKPLPSRHVAQTISDIDEVWHDSTGDIEGESADAIRRDLFQLVGIVRGLMMALELKQPDFVPSQHHQQES